MQGTVIIVAYNAEDIIGSCLASLKASAENGGFKVIVVDNDSSDKTVEIVRRSFPEAVILESGENGGFAAGNNRGCREAEGEWIFLLNPDAEIDADCLKTLSEYLKENPDCGVVCPAVFDSNGKPTVSFFPFTTPMYSMFSALGLPGQAPLNRINRRWRLTRCNPVDPVEVDRCLGAAMMIRRTVWDQIGGMDEQFFLYSEEEDFCYRARKSGWKIIYNPAASINHIGAGATRHDNALAIASAAWSRQLYLMKHYSRFSSLITRWAWIKMLALRWLLAKLTGSSVEILRGYHWAIKSLLRPGWFERELRPPRREAETKRNVNR